MLRWRLLSALIIISVLLGFICLDYWHPWGAPTGLWLLPLLLLVTGLATSEALGLLRANDLQPVPWAVYGGTLMVVLGSAIPILYEWTGSAYPVDCPFGQLGWPTVMTGLALIVLFVSEMLRYEQPGRVIMHVASGLLVIVYVGLLVSFLVALRRFSDHQWGMVALISVVAVVKVSDSGAYFIGRSCGRHKLAPTLSPKKTVEGALGGLVFGSLAALVYFYWLVPLIFGLEQGTPSGLDIGCWILYGLILSVAGMIGDLAESMWKRDSQQKDSSRWLPGLGGALDVLDSLLVAGLPAYLCWALGLVGPV